MIMECFILNSEFFHIIFYIHIIIFSYCLPWIMFYIESTSLSELSKKTKRFFTDFFKDYARLLSKSEVSSVVQICLRG